jgi:4-amino-4-deoxy-L-arabinose transferase-like glycosyltransferase
MVSKHPPAKPLLAPKRIWLIGVLLLLFGLGLAIRVYDLTDLPLDFHPTRQLFSALKARGMYYQTLTDTPQWQQQMAIQQWKTRVTVEPEVLERLAAFTYRFTGEQLWVARLYSSLFWLIGGVFLFLLARSWVSTDGALVTTAVYLFLPYGIIASRSFQPDPLMVMLILAFWWAVLHWVQRSSWAWTIAAGLLGGMAIYIKLPAAFFVVGGALGGLLGCYSLRESMRKPQVWALILLGALPGLLYVVYGVWISGFLGQQFGGRFITKLLISPIFYLQWAGKIDQVVGPLLFALGVLGVFFFSNRSVRTFAIGIWGAYFIYGLCFDYHISSHDYYSLPLIPIVAISLAPLAELILGRLRDVTASSRWLRLTAVVVLLYVPIVTLWGVRSQMKAVDYRPQADFWEHIGDLLGHQSPVVALTQDYGLSLDYWGWTTSTDWPTSGDIQYHTQIRNGKYSFEADFNSLTKAKSFFLITNLEDLERQPKLKQRLYADYPVFAQGAGYLIFDLQHPLSSNY